MPEHLNLRHLSFFVKAAEVGSISRAAEDLHVSQPAVSQAISDLERQLGVQLLIRRRSRGATPTPSGHRLLGDARRLLAEAGDFVGMAADLRSGVGGVLSIGCAPTIAPFLMPRLMSEFGSAFPAVEFNYTEGLADELQHELRVGRLEIAVLYDMGVSPDFDRVELFRMRPYVLLAEGHSLAAFDAIPLAELEAHDMVVLDFPESESFARALVASAGVRPRIARRSTSFETVRSLVAHGAGFAVLHQRPAADVSYDGVPLLVRPIVGDPPQMRVLIVTTPGAQLTQRAQAFVTFARRFAGRQYSSEAPIDKHHLSI